ncbi:MAG: flagellin FliC [Thermoleophilia bacterium]|nr:flagellin FliC [Thermoleophilia bacterium]
MSLRIAHNIDALAAHRHAGIAADRIAVAMRRLSSGLRINSAADDAAGLGISERMRGQIRSLEMANRNIQDGISLLNTAEAALDEVHSILHRARELQVQYNNGTNDINAKMSIARELIQLSNEIGRIEQTTTFNGVPLLQSATTTITLQVGANAGDTISFSMADLFGIGTALVRPVTFFTPPGVPANINWMDVHIDDVATARGRLGSVVNRLEHTLNDNQSKIEAYMSAESRIRDADMAKEMGELTRQQVLQQTSLAMLRQTQRPGNTARVNDLLK